MAKLLLLYCAPLLLLYGFVALTASIDHEAVEVDSDGDFDLDFHSLMQTHHQGAPRIERQPQPSQKDAGAMQKTTDAMSLYMMSSWPEHSPQDRAPAASALAEVSQVAKAQAPQAGPQGQPSLVQALQAQEHTAKEKAAEASAAKEKSAEVAVAKKKAAEEVAAKEKAAEVATEKKKAQEPEAGPQGQRTMPGVGFVQVLQAVHKVLSQSPHSYLGSSSGQLPAQVALKDESRWDGTVLGTLTTQPWRVDKLFAILSKTFTPFHLHLAMEGTDT